VEIPEVDNKSSVQSEPGRLMSLMTTKIGLFNEKEDEELVRAVERA
jgi:hypothetical protein